MTRKLSHKDILFREEAAPAEKGIFVKKSYHNIFHLMVMRFLQLSHYETAATLIGFSALIQALFLPVPIYLIFWALSLNQSNHIMRLAAWAFFISVLGAILSYATIDTFPQMLLLFLYSDTLHLILPWIQNLFFQSGLGSWLALAFLPVPDFLYVFAVAAEWLSDGSGFVTIWNNPLLTKLIFSLIVPKLVYLTLFSYINRRYGPRILSFMENHLAALPPVFVLAIVLVWFLK